MEFDFDRITSRAGTNAIKYDLAQVRGKPVDAISLWVADMDFPTAPCIQEALAEKARHGIYGYSRPDARYYQAVKHWFKTRHDFDVQDEWIVNTPGVVFAIGTAIKACTAEGDAVLIQRPVYYPFFNMIHRLGRRVVNSPLVLEDGQYRMDFDDFEDKIVSEGVRLFVLCSPHNPCGRVWRREELERISWICQRNKVVVVSDEIHSDITFGGNRHVSYGLVSHEALHSSIICTSPSKTFNLAGLQFSNIFIANQGLRRDFCREIDKTGYDEPSVMGIVAATSAYSDGGAWFDAAREYIWGNIAFLRDYIARNEARIRVIVPEGTYLVWLDFSSLGISDGEINDRILNRAKVWLDNGTMFGKEGEKFQRINCATPRSVLAEAIKRICREFSDVR